MTDSEDAEPTPKMSGKLPAKPPRGALPGPKPAEPDTSETRHARPARALASVALLVALLAGGVAAYLVWETRTDDPGATLKSILTELTAIRGESADRVARTDEELGALRAELARVNRELGTQKEALDAALAALADARAERFQATTPSSREWRLAEIEYLLSVANHRLSLEHDAAGALALLDRADQLLVELDDFVLHDVRASLTTERLSLRGFKGVDTPGLYLRLEALKGLIERLPLKLPEYIADEGADNDQPVPGNDGSFLDKVFSRLEGIVRFRRHEGTPVRPLLPPEQSDYLEQHLRLAVDRAQLAVLRRDQAIFEASLASARHWLHRFVDPERGTVAEAIRELDTLLAVNLAVEPPDISGSLARLRDLPNRATVEADPE